MINPRSRSLLIAVILASGLSLTSADAQSVYTSGHTDLGIGYEDGALVPHWHLDAGNIVDGSPLAEESEFAPEELVARFLTTRASASGSADYLGVPTGTTLYMGGPSVAWQPYLGFGSEELDPGDWSTPIKITLTGWTAPDGGEFSLYTTSLNGTSTVDIFLSTFDPSVANIDGVDANAFNLPVGGHEHYTFGFTQEGYYTLTLQFSGTHATDGFKTASGTFGFLIGPNAVVPEPSTSGLLIAVGLAFLVFFRKSRKRFAPFDSIR